MFSKKVATVGSLKIGKDNPVRVQTMWESRIDRSQFGVIKERISRLYRDGLELIRFSVLDEGDVQLLKDLKDELPIPVVADIHFDYKLALSALESGIPFTNYGTMLAYLNGILKRSLELFPDIAALIDG